MEEGPVLWYKYFALCVVCRGRKRYVSEGDGGAIKAPEDWALDKEQCTWDYEYIVTELDLDYRFP